jgi:2Fe-2S ferredoxin
MPDIDVTFIKPDGSKVEAKALVGSSLLTVAHENDIDIEGACEGNMACSTCHLIIDEDHYDSLSEPCEEEEDMLDLAVGLTATSRLGCQITLDETMNGLIIHVPKQSRNMMGL